MKLLTINFLTCAVKSCKSSPLSFPLHFRDAELERREIDYNPTFLQNILPRLDWDAIRSTATEVCYAFIYIKIKKKSSHCVFLAGSFLWGQKKKDYCYEFISFNLLPISSISSAQLYLFLQNQNFFSQIHETLHSPPLHSIKPIHVQPFPPFFPFPFLNISNPQHHLIHRKTTAPQ